MDLELQNVLEKLRPFQRQCFNFATGEPYYIKQNAEKDDNSTATSCAKMNPPRAPQYHGRVLLADEMGLGKTVTSLAIMLKYHSEWPLLILCPSSLRYMWPNEIEKFIPSLPSSSVYVVSGFDDVDFVQRKKVQIVVASYSLLQTRSAAAHALRNDIQFRCVIADESHNLKEKNSQRCTLALPLLTRARRLILISGTPALARPVELWPQLHSLDKDEFGTFSKFTERYCDAKRGRFGWDVKGISHIEELHGKLQNVMVRHLKSHVLNELPPKQRTIVPVKMDSPMAAGECKQVLETMNRARLDVQELQGDDALHANFEARRLLMNAYQMTGIAKAPAVADFILDYLSGSNEKIIVFGHHKEVLTKIEDAVSRKYKGIGHIKIDGDVPPAERPHLVKKFQTCDKVRVALLSVTAAGVGLTLTAASTVIFAELHWTPGVLAQAEDRCHRIGQVNAVQVLYCICKDEDLSIDMTLWRMLSRKVGNVARLVDGTKGASLEAQESSKFNDCRSTSSHLQAGISGEEELSNFFAQQQGISLNKWNDKKSVPVKGTIQSFFQKSIEKCKASSNSSKTNGIAESSAEESTSSKPDTRNVESPLNSWICDACTYNNDSQNIGSEKAMQICGICGSQRFLQVKNAVNIGGEENTRHNFDDIKCLSSKTECFKKATAITPCRESTSVEVDLTASDSFSDIIDLTDSCDDDEKACSIDLDKPVTSFLRFSVSKNTGRISVHAYNNGVTIRFNFDVNEVIANDSLQDVTQSKTKRHRSEGPAISSRTQKASDITSQYLDDDSIIRLLSDSKICASNLDATKSIENCKNDVKLFISSYLALSEAEKKALQEESEQNPVQSSFCISTQTSRDSYTRYGGGAKERAMENYLRSGSITSNISQLDRDLINGLACAWCASYLTNREKGVDATYCSIKCAVEGRLKRGGKYASSNVRSQVFALEKGVCRRCKIDAHSLYVRIVALEHPAERLNALINANWVLPTTREGMDRLLSNPVEGDFWQADHIKAVAIGGGNASLTNLQTLCTPCHKIETNKLRAVLRLRGSVDNKITCEDNGRMSQKSRQLDLRNSFNIKSTTEK